MDKDTKDHKSCKETPGQREILIIEDEMEMRFYLMTMVKSIGCVPVVTRNGAEGLAALEKAIPAMIVLDIMMPEKGGALVYQELKARPGWLKIPLLIFSGVDRKAFEHYVRMLNAASDNSTPPPEYYVEKSADPDYLRGMMLKCMENGPDENPAG